MSKKRNSLSVLDQVILYAGLIMVAALIAVIVLAICLHCKAGAINVLTVIAAALSGILLGLTIFYQIRQFHLSRFQSIFHHQMELHAQLVDRVIFDYNSKRKVGGEAIRHLAESLTGELKQNCGFSNSEKYSIERLFDSCEFDNVLKETFNRNEHVLTPYFRHITSVLEFLSHRAPKEERRAYPKYYLNIFSKCELRLYFYYVIYEVNRIADRLEAKIKIDGDNDKLVCSDENDLFKLLYDVDYLRYVKAIATTGDVLLNFISDESTKDLIRIKFYKS